MATQASPSANLLPSPAERSPVGRAVVIGAGLAGLASALRLVARGYEVTVLERGPAPGGRAWQREVNGFVHDGGPTVLTAPFLVDELFGLLGKRREDFLSYLPVEPWYRFLFAEGGHLDYGPAETLAPQWERFEGRPGETYPRFREHARALFEAGFTQLADRPFDRPATMAAQVPQLLRLGAYRSAYRATGSYFRDPRLRLAFSLPALLLGGDPHRVSSIYLMIHELEQRYGVWYPQGGMGALVRALADLLVGTGRAECRYGETVVRLETDQHDRVRAVRTAGGGTWPADLAVYNGDPVLLYRDLLPSSSLSAVERIRARTGQHSFGVYVVYFGLRREYPEVAQHTILVDRDERSSLRTICRGEGIADRLHLYLHRASATDPEMAPAGGDSFYCLCPVPNLERATLDWAVEGPQLRERILDRLEETVLPGLRTSLDHSFAVDPHDFEDRLLSFRGAGFGLAPLLHQSAYFRFHNRADRPANLFLAGAGVHPGAGVPGVLSSARALERLLPQVSPS
jgi:phytoene desaturase